MVPYFDVFPSAWDLSAEHGGRRFWVMDYWCLVPGCGCNELRADVMGERGGSVGFVRVEAEGWKVVEVEGDRVAGEIWEALAADAHDRRMLEKRRLSMLRVARELPAFLGSSVASRRRGAAGAVGRNEPCPCGSGKKFKRCCGE
ncbi:MAG: SEC-C domain-containing protein [Deltaproteobacteria bacterium]|nr:SEC-C domain-containing protein [Deltaproteobacteria bacterium]